jgi:hypothetical protein
MYEVKIERLHAMQLAEAAETKNRSFVGFADQRAVFDYIDNIGVGDSAGSWGVGTFGASSAVVTKIPEHSVWDVKERDNAFKWVHGDTIAIGVDVEARTILVAVKHNSTGNISTVARLTNCVVQHGFIPSLSLTENVQLRVNFGDRAFSVSTHPAFEGYQPVQQWFTTHKANLAQGLAMPALAPYVVAPATIATSTAVSVPEVKSVTVVPQQAAEVVQQKHPAPVAAVDSKKETSRLLSLIQQLHDMSATLTAEELQAAGDLTAVVDGLLNGSRLVVQQALKLSKKQQ